MFRDFWVVSIVVPFWGYLLGSLKELVKPKKGTTMETVGVGLKALRV